MNLKHVLDAVAIFFIISNATYFGMIGMTYNMDYNIGVGSGESMEPVIAECDVIVFVGNDFEDAEKGDIIVYEGQGRMVAHEYIGASVAKGINNEEIDPVAVSESNYRGEVQAVLPTSSVCDIVRV